MKLFFSSMGLVVCVAACASTPPPTAKVASTQSAVQSARQAGADNVPEAKTHLTAAENELQRGRTLMNKGDNKEATAVLTRAEADASLATALSREAKQKAATAAAEQRVRGMSPTLEPSNR